MSNTIIRPAGHEEWLQERKKGIGSSEVATILGLNRWETPYQLWRRKTGLDAPKAESFAMKAGHYLEDAVARFWHDETGRDIIKRSATDWLIRDDERPFLQVSPDRTYWLDGRKGKDNKGILECKTTQMAIDPDDLPEHWFVQVQYQLGVAGMEHGSLAWLCSGREFGYRDIELVPEFYSWIVENVERFWKENVIGGQEPEAISVADVMMKYNRHKEGKLVEATAEAYSAYMDLREVKEQISVLDARKEALEDQLKMALGDAEALTHEGKQIVTWRSPKPSRRLDSKAMQQAYPDIAEQFMTETQGSRRFLVK